MAKTVMTGDPQYDRGDVQGIVRLYKTVSLTVANGVALSNEVDMSIYSGGVIHMSAIWTAAAIGFKVCSISGGTFTPLYRDDALTLVQIGDGTNKPVASTSYAIPVEVFGARYMKLWSQNGSASDANQGGDRIITMDLKS